MPSRRDLVRTCGTATAAVVAGCLGTGGDPPDGSETARRTATTTADAPTDVREVDPAAVADRGVPRSPTIESDAHEPFRGFVVGEYPASPGDHYETPHVWVWNLTGERATVTVTLGTGGTDLRRIEAEFPAGEPLAVVLRERGTYEFAVRAGDREETVAVGPDRFRCNASATDVAVRPDEIESGTVSTSMACTTMPGGG